MNSYVKAVYLIGLNDLKMGVRIFSMIPEARVLEPLKMQTQLQISMKW
jgi:hypothetical protein